MNLFEKLKTNSITPHIKQNKGYFVVDENGASPFLIASNYFNNKGKYLLVTSNLYKAQQLFSNLVSLIGKDKVGLFPCDELIRAESLAENNELIAGRIFTLYQILHNEVDIIITNVAGVMRYIPKPERFMTSSFKIKLNDVINVSDLRRKLTIAGYHLVNKIDQSLQFAVRGDIIDVFSITDEYPTRIELFGDEVDSIRKFDISTQTSISKVEECEILPASDVLLNDEEIQLAIKVLNNEKEKIANNISQENQNTLSESLDDIINELLEKNITSKLYKYYSYFSDDVCSLFEYCKEYKTIFINDDGINQQATNLIFESNDYIHDLKSSFLAVGNLSYYQELNRIVPFNIIHFNEFASKKGEIEFNAHPVSISAGKQSDSVDIIKMYLDSGYTVLCLIGASEHLNYLEEAFEKENIAYQKIEGLNIPDKAKVGLSFFSFASGIVFDEEKICILTQRELFNSKGSYYRYTSKFKEGSVLKSFEELEHGDYVVHEFQGIGIFDCLQTLFVDGAHRDYIKIIYSNDEILYVPVAQFQLVRKYQGKEGAKPRLSRLHSSDWEKTKKKIKDRIDDLANRLMNLYQERSKIEGFAFESDDELQMQFEENCDFELTKDQITSLKEIKHDMESSHPMDRLLCGDVGFGKTEVAFRAAFKAMLSGKQVAFLCPTTLLARQHYENALTRFAGFDINVALFSRMVPEAIQKENIKGVLNGSIHLVIGTHRLLSKDIVFDNLGLLIVDEEQRFGVEQKEKIKELKSNVDVLTLSATPIPRTLQMSLIGMRNMSVINTPPKERMPVQTYVMPYKANVVKELIERELSRNGQVFYLHNRIANLYEVASKIAKQIPNATIAAAHGQMDKEELEDIMDRFYAGQIQILVCTSIIENGIDVPNANMIVVDNADCYGLSQLYQIKGRVGRSDRIGYAYLLYNENKLLNDNAKKRLKAIKEFTALGSGYKVAQRDLMIRGAGDILGPEQAGYIDSIGLEMYIKLLNETVKEKLKPEQNIENNENKPIFADLNIDAYIPDDYAIEANKIELYHLIDETESIEELARVKMDIRDVYGKMPINVEYLFDRRSIDILAKTSKIENLLIYPNYVEIILGKAYLNIKGVGNIVLSAMIPYMEFSRTTYLNGTFKIIMNKRKTWVEDLTNILSELDSIMSRVKK